MRSASNAKLTASPNPLLSVGVALLAVSYALYQLVERLGPAQADFLIVMSTIQSVVWVLLFRGRARLSGPFVIFCACLAFLISRSTTPLFTDDYFRYFW